MNCFRLAKIDKEKIASTILELSDPANISNLQSRLSDAVTNHIKKIWPEHPIKVLFVIDANSISFLVEDEDVKYQAKTTGQRSDGFRQFISFLLTLSIETTTGELQNTLLLIDEPETHLHPQAQINLLKELINISSKNGNIVIFATHSSYMIDRKNLNRCLLVKKLDNRRTTLEKVDRKEISISELNFEIFDIPSTDLHNELYGFIEEKDKSKLDSLKKTKTWKNKKSGKSDSISICVYIRHSIHHPENQLNAPYTEDELRESISSMRKLKSEIP